MDYFAHNTAIVESNNIGGKTRIWAYAHILPGARIGEDCNICDHTFIENDVVIGSRVTIKCGVQVWDGVTLEDDVFIGPNATFTNDLFPRSKQRPESYAKTLICTGASIGANATILAGITIGMNAMVGAGSVVTTDIPPNAIVRGNPARIEGYITTSNTGGKTNLDHVFQDSDKRIVSIINAVNLYNRPMIEDVRGRLTFGEFRQDIPFEPKRYFIVYNVPSKEVRGEHAHKELHQFLICVKGSCCVVVDDGNVREELVLNMPTIGLHIPPMIWATQYKYTEDAVLLVFASDIYKADDYIRDYNEFLKIKREQGIKKVDC